MNFAWDSEKSETNLLERMDRRDDYGEVRIVAIGLAGGLALTVVYTDRLGESGDTIRRIISARRSSRREREAYEKAV
jgi:hypothetical protein